METYIYLVRHAESPYTEGNERTRGLTTKGYSDLATVTEILQSEEIDVIVSSPYTRAVLTVEPIAKILGLEIKIFEDLREHHFCSEDYNLSDDDLSVSIERLLSDQYFSLPGGESNKQLLARSLPVFMKMLDQFKGKRVVIGTHGIIMTALMGYYDSQFDYEFFKQTTKPDIYKMTFREEQLIQVVRLWR